MTEAKLKLIKNWFVWAALIVAFYYQTYRYPLDYGIEPPLPWRVGKYALLASICLFSSKQFIKKITYFKLFEWTTLLVFFVLGACGVLQSEKFFLQAAFCTLAAFWIAQSCNGQISYSSLLHFLVIAWGINILFYAVELLGLVFFEKTFVHFQPNIIESRFGGMLVEPLGAPYLSFIFIGLAYEFKGRLRWLILISSVLTMLMTHTLTAGLFLLIAGCTALILIKNFDRYKLGLLGVLASTVIAGVVFMFWYLKENVPYFTNKWNASIVPHAEYWWPKRWPLLPQQESMFSETWWVMLVQSMGIIWTCAYGLLMLLLLADCVRRTKFLVKPRPDGTWRGVFLGVYLSSAFVIFGSMNQLYTAMYPVSFLFMLFCFFVKYNKISQDITPTST